MIKGWISSLIKMKKSWSSWLTSQWDLLEPARDDAWSFWRSWYQFILYLTLVFFFESTTGYLLVEWHPVVRHPFICACVVMCTVAMCALQYWMLFFQKEYTFDRVTPFEFMSLTSVTMYFGGTEGSPKYSGILALALILWYIIFRVSSFWKSSRRG